MRRKCRLICCSSSSKDIYTRFSFYIISTSLYRFVRPLTIEIVRSEYKRAPRDYFTSIRYSGIYFPLISVTPAFHLLNMINYVTLFIIIDIFFYIIIDPIHLLQNIPKMPIAHTQLHLMPKH